MSAVRATALRAGGACVRCRKGKTKCVYENGRAPCKNCSKGMHECYLPSESMSHGGHGVSPARAARARETLPSERASGAATGDRHGSAHPTAVASRNSAPATEKYVYLFFNVLAHASCSPVPSISYHLLRTACVLSTTLHPLRRIRRRRRATPMTAAGSTLPQLGTSPSRWLAPFLRISRRTKNALTQLANHVHLSFTI